MGVAPLVIWFVVTFVVFCWMVWRNHKEVQRDKRDQEEMNTYWEGVNAMIDRKLGE